MKEVNEELDQKTKSEKRQAENLNNQKERERNLKESKTVSIRC
ncbi:MAG: hypothetical protein BRC46_16985 [Cyanobacteria bacterium QS_6_48_18]|jgi:hypothetical protein|nr:MAG: hypothetical protein BRC46_16985 [Cyanobacteria bacterium QS_6_48_18]